MSDDRLREELHRVASMSPRFCEGCLMIGALIAHVEFYEHVDHSDLAVLTELAPEVIEESKMQLAMYRAARDEHIAHHMGNAKPGAIQ